MSLTKILISDFSTEFLMFLLLRIRRQKEILKKTHPQTKKTPKRLIEICNILEHFFKL